MHYLSVKAIVFMFFTLFFITGCASIQTINMDDIETVDVSQITTTDDINALTELSQGKMPETPVIFHLPAGFQLPVHFNLDTPIAQMDNQCGNLTFSQAVYLYLDSKEVLVSPDKAQWATIDNMDLIKQLFGGKQGELAIGLSSSKDEGPLLDIKVMLHQ